jgi:hypothetical protein
LKSALRHAIQSDHHKLAKIIFEKFGDSKQLISKEPNTINFFDRYFTICNYLESNSTAKTRTKKAELQIFKDKLCRLLDVNATTNTLLPSSLKDDYDCPICFSYMCRPKKIFSCNNIFKPHFICSACLVNLPKKECPSCKEDFNKRKPKHWPDMEKRAEEFEI